MVVKRRVRRSFKRRRRLILRKRVSKSTKMTRVVNLYRTYDLTGSSAFQYSSALVPTGNGYLQHDTAAIAGNVAYGSFGVYFRLSDLPNVAEYANMFEQFRINKVVVVITPMATGVLTGAAPTSASTQSAVIFHWALDFDDAAVPTAGSAGIDALRQRTGYKHRNAYAFSGKPIVISIKPKVLAALYGPVSNGYSSKPSTWVDEANISLPHYGLKCVVESLSSGSTVNHFFKVETKLYLSLRGMQ